MQMYDEISTSYDHFVNWNNRLPFEIPFLEGQLASLKEPGSPLRVLDAACGTAMHAIEFARRGYLASGADISQGMVAQARLNARAAGLSVDVRQAGFGELQPAFGPAAFDALLCLGNSLPHLLTLAALEAALRDFAAVLRPGGKVIIQNRNFDSVLASQERFMEPQTYKAQDQEQIFVRFYDFLPDGLINFHMLTLSGQQGVWKQQVTTSQLYPLQAQELAQALAKTGFEEIRLFGGLNGVAFNAASSPNLVAVASLK